MLTDIHALADHFLMALTNINTCYRDASLPLAITSFPLLVPPPRLQSRFLGAAPGIIELQTSLTTTTTREAAKPLLPLLR